MYNKNISFRLPQPTKYLKKIFFLLPDTAVIKNFFVYSFGALLLRSIHTIIMPLNMRKLTPEDYGSLALITSFINIMTALIGLGLRQMLSIEYFHCTANERKQLIRDIIVIYICFALPILLLLMYHRTLLYRFIFVHHVSGWIIALSLVIIFLTFFVELYYQILRYEQKASQVTFLQITLACTTLFLTVMYLWIFNLGFASILVAHMFTLIITALIACSTYKKEYPLNLSTPPSFKQTIHYLKIGLPFIPSMLFGWLLASGDRWVLAQYTQLHDVGIYSVADLFSQLFYFLVLYPWSGSYLPYIQQRYAQNKTNLAAIEKNNQHIMIASMLCTALCITIGCIAGKSVLAGILPLKYHEALNYIWLLLMGQVFLLGSYFAASLVQFQKRTYFLALSLAIPAVCNIALNYLLIPRLGILGCTLATLISYVIYFLIMLGYNWWLQKYL